MKESTQAAQDPALHAALNKATEALLSELGPDGHWSGDLSSSALSTATAIVALSVAESEPALIADGLRWLARNANPDGGWGDTIHSKSNISTTALCWAAFGAAAADAEHPETVHQAVLWLENASGPMRSDAGSALVAAISARYGKDRTFSVPILMTLALSGRLGPGGWRHVHPLPFELAALPHQVFGALQLPVVSYALPALIAIGQVIAHHSPSRNLFARAARALTRRRTLKILSRIQPPNGGFLEATPLTSFVTMSLAGMGLREHLVVKRGVEFLTGSVRPDGSWPIDTNLATWVSTLAIKALSEQPRWASPETRSELRQWLLSQQYKVTHPYTNAAPGGWAWTDLPGGVPDADDTAGALIALLKLGAIDSITMRAGMAGARWLRNLQNRDGGIPTFCRGWGALPFDRSSPDLTAHALRAWSAWLPQFPKKLRLQCVRSIEHALIFLANSQAPDGSWLPLWFGNEHAPEDQNRTYGTAHVLIALRELDERGFHFPPELTERAAAWLVDAQDSSGGWSGFPGGPPSTEETALAVEALAGYRADAASAGTDWLIARVEDDSWRDPAPIGFYFAKLWYFERLYPQIFTVAALGRMSGLRPCASVPPVP